MADFGIPGGTAKRAQNRPFFGPPFWPAKTAPGGVPERPKLEVWRFCPKTRPGDVISPGVAGGVPGDPGGSLGKASERLISKKKKKLPINRFSGAILSIPILKLIDIFK